MDKSALFGEVCLFSTIIITLEKNSHLLEEEEEEEEEEKLALFMKRIINFQQMMRCKDKGAVQKQIIKQTSHISLRFSLIFAY